MRQVEGRWGNRYEGEFEGEKAEGRGRYEWNDEEKYEGEFKGEMMQGEGVFYWSNGDRYQG